MARPRTHDHDAVLDRWSAGMRAPDIAAVLGLPQKTVKAIIAAARALDDPRAARRRPVKIEAPPIAPDAPLHVRLGIKAETIFVPTLDGADHRAREAITVASATGGPVVYARPASRDKQLAALMRETIRRAMRAAEHT